MSVIQNSQLKQKAFIATLGRMNSRAGQIIDILGAKLLRPASDSPHAVTLA
jgi:hypothetical protein